MKVDQDRWMYLPWKKGGHACDKCKTLISHEDLIGQSFAGRFTVQGYICPKCGRKYPEKQENLVKMNWRMI
jgi:RNA polymerase subunit RPABC4/transcription elongation factor Spt4